MSNDRRVGGIGRFLRIIATRARDFFETIGAPASGDFGERSCGGWPKVADYAHRAAHRADPLGSNPPYEFFLGRDRRTVKSTS
jgi:hypothetical protein